MATRVFQDAPPCALALEHQAHLARVGRDPRRIRGLSESIRTKNASDFSAKSMPPEASLTRRPNMWVTGHDRASQRNAGIASIPPWVCPECDKTKGDGDAVQPLTNGVTYQVQAKWARDGYQPEEKCERYGVAQQAGDESGDGGLRDRGWHGDGGRGLHGSLRHAHLRAGRDGAHGERAHPRRRHRRGQGDVPAPALEPAGGVCQERPQAGEGSHPQLRPPPEGVPWVLRTPGGIGRDCGGDRAVLGGGAGSQLTSWGEGASVSHFSDAVPGLSLSGDSATGSMGMDYERGRLLTGFALALKADAFRVRTESESVWTPGVGSLAAARADASRLRALLDGSRTFALAGG